MDKKLYLEAIQEAIRSNFGLSVEHVETEKVTEQFRGTVMWEKDIEIFCVSDGKKERVFAWGFEEKGGWEYVTVKEAPLVATPLDAVRLYIHMNQESVLK